MTGSASTYSLLRGSLASPSGLPASGLSKLPLSFAWEGRLKDAFAAMRGTAGMPLFLLVLHTKCTIGQVPPVSCTFRSPMGASVS